MAYKVRDILDYKELRLVPMQNSDHVIDEIAPLRTFQATLLAGFRKWLARKSGAQNIVLRDILELDLPDISRRFQSKILLIKSGKVMIEFAREDTAMPKLRECQMEAAQAYEKINEPERPCLGLRSWRARERRLFSFCVPSQDLFPECCRLGYA